MELVASVGGFGVGRVWLNSIMVSLVCWLGIGGIMLVFLVLGIVLLIVDVVCSSKGKFINSLSFESSLVVGGWWWGVVVGFSLVIVGGCPLAFVVVGVVEVVWWTTL